MMSMSGFSETNQSTLPFVRLEKMENPDTTMAAAEKKTVPTSPQRQGPAWLTDEEASLLPRVTKEEIEQKWAGRGDGFGAELRPLPVNISCNPEIFGLQPGVAAPSQAE